MVVGRWQFAGTKKTAALIIVLLVQIAILAVMVLNSYAVLFLGEKILLKVVPVDPRSLFQGDYVRLGYSFSSLDLTKIRHNLDPRQLMYQDKIYLALEKRGQTWDVVRASVKKEEVSGSLFIEGKFLSAFPGALTEEQQKAYMENGMEPPLNTLQLELPIERFYVPEGKGLEIEKKIIEGEVYAQVAVYKGKARVVNLISKP